MLPYKMNKKLLALAFIGILLFFSTNVVSSLNDYSVDSEMIIPQVTQQQATEAARTFLLKRNPTVKVSKSTVVYESNSSLSAYVQKNHLSKQYEEKYNTPYPLDFWQVQMNDDTTGTQYFINVSMEKPIITGWNTQGKSVSGNEAEARKVAEQYLQTAGYDLKSLRFSKPDSRSHDAYLFVYENSAVKIGDAFQTLSVEVSGNDIFSFQADFKVPEGDKAWMSRQIDYARNMSQINLYGMIVFAIIAIIIAIIKRKQISFQRGLLLSGLFFIISFVNSLNTLPAEGIALDFQNPTIEQIIMIIFYLIFNFIFALAVYFMLLSGVQMWREKGWNAWPRWKDANFRESVFYGMGRGYLICFFVIGVQQVLFLFAGKVFHSFSINDPSQSEYNMLWPALFPSLAWAAAISEEIIFRLFAIILLQKIIRIRFLAVLIPSIIWALGHTAYTIYPSYTRLFEVTVLGIIFSYTFLKYGLITAIFTHAAMDSLLMGLSLMASAKNIEYSLIGLLYILLPAIVGCAIMLLKRKSSRPILDPPTLY
ncbi:MAG: abortive infection protein [Bacilli bacterium]|nr:abortive infection protein [Bacilli bacterium]